jgi:DNA replication protein DnaC
MCEHIEQRLHEYFYNGETELRLSHLVGVRQKHNESIANYVRRFRETRNKYHSLTIVDKDLTELAFAGLTLVMQDKMDG